MEAMCKIIQEKNPEIVVYGCSSHWLNLLGQDIIPSQISAQVIEINKYFRNHHIPSALLSEVKGSVKPQLPNDTRWNSQYKCMDTYTTNRPYMLMLLAQHEDLADNRI